MNAYVVIGAGFGDEGKGATVNELVTRLDVPPLVIRFNGGPQAGHTVIHKGTRHVFSHFGSGTLQGAPTFWSKYCPVEPGSFMVEYKTLKDKGVTPKFYVDPDSPVITPFDKYYNQQWDRLSNNGTCGIGFGATIARHENTVHKLKVKDLSNSDILSWKLANISNYYTINLGVKEISLPEIEQFIHYCGEMIQHIHMSNFENIVEKHGHLVFEGAQGLLLDQELGFFPHVTRSYTGSTNVFKMIKGLSRNIPIKFNPIYVSRPYLTRHGNGPLPFEDNVIKYYLKKEVLENETNVTNKWQGKFRYAPFNPELLNHVLRADYLTHYHSGIIKGGKPTLCITCLDHFKDDEKVPLVQDHSVKEVPLDTLGLMITKANGFNIMKI